MATKDLSEANERVIKQTLVNGKYVVSTIRLDSMVKGLDSVLGFISDSDELMDRPGKLSDPGDFETMVFNSDEEGEIKDWTELDFDRYFSREDALIGHVTLVEKWEEK